MDEEFDILTVKILAGEASADEQARLERLMAQKAELKRDFADLKAAWDAVREIGPLARAMEAPPGSIPSARLSGLQAAVKKKFGSRSGEDSIVQSVKLGRQPQTAARRIEPVHEGNFRFGNEPSSAFARVKQWFTATIGMAPMFVAVALLIVIALAGGILLISRRTTVPPAAEETGAVAYLAGGEVWPEVRRGGRPIVVGASLRVSDEVRLPAGSRIRLITASGLMEISGPRVARVGDLLPNRTGYSQSSSSQDASAKETDALRIALFRPIEPSLASALLVTTRSGQSIPLYSPLGSTANPTPLILWKSEPGKNYDITITDEFDPKATPLRLSGVVPPVDFAKVEAWKGRTLAKDGLYRLVLSETGKPLSACEYTFRTLKAWASPSSTAPAEKLSRAYRILKAEPSRMGDALAELMTLPPASAESDLALRLKLFAFGQQGYKDDFEAVAESIRTLNAVP